MLKLREAGLYTSPAAKGKASHFAGFSYGSHVQQNGVNFSRSVKFIKVATNPSPSETIAIGAKTYTFVASGAVGDQINIGISVVITAANICSKINSDQASTFCTAYQCEDPAEIILVDNRSWITGQSGTAWTNDGAKVIELTPWQQSLPESGASGVEGSGTFKVALTDEGTTPVDPLRVQYYDGMGYPSSGWSGAEGFSGQSGWSGDSGAWVYETGYSGTTPYQNFVY